MSVSLKELELANRPLPDRLVEILGSDPEKAFDVIDLYALVNGSDPRTVAMVFLIATTEERTAALARYEAALNELVEKGTVVRKDYRNQPHYFLARGRR